MSMRKVSIKSSTTSTLELKTELLKWICERHATNERLDRELLRQKAMELATSFGVIGFKCSEAWLTIFLKKHGFSPRLTSCDGPTFPDYRAWIDLLRSLLTQYRHRDLFNVDELVMYPNFFPSRRPVDIPFQRHGDDVFPEIIRVTSQTRKIIILLCCNSSGTEKLEPLISDPPMADESIEGSRENRQQIGCATSAESFLTWLEKLNSRMSESQRSILLLLSRERIRSLRDVQRFSNVKLIFLPRDFPTHLRPLRGDVFHSVKMTYRRRYADMVRRHRDRTGGSREWDRGEIVDGITEAWSNVPQELVVSSFQRTKFREDESSLKIQCPEWDSLGTGVSFRKFVTFDDELCDETRDPRINREPRFNALTNNEHRYNLRRSRRPIVELTDDRTIDEKPRRTVERSKPKADRVVGREILQEKLSSNDQGSSWETRENRVELPLPDELVGESETRISPGDPQNFFGDAGPSGEVACDETRTFVTDSAALEFDDEERLPDDAELRLQIVNAIERCGEDVTRIPDPSPGSSKRPRNVSDAREGAVNDDEENARGRKLARSDSEWSKRYETNFVFGSEIDGNEEESSASDGLKRGQADEIEKRCIFTLEGSTDPPSASYLESKD